MQGDPYRGRSDAVTGYFSDLADVYERHRPHYPAEAIEMITDGLPSGATIADIGCGTGIASRQLAETGAGVIGIEPNEAMRHAAEAAASRHPAAARMTFQSGTGEDTGLPDASVDAIVCAQSFHWFDADAALREFARALKPSGRLALMWNQVAKSNAFSANYRMVMNEAGQLARREGRSLRRNRGLAVRHSSFFAGVREHRFHYAQTLDVDGALGRAHSASYFPVSGRERERLEQMLRDCFASCADIGDNGARFVTLHYATLLILAEAC